MKLTPEQKKVVLDRVAVMLDDPFVEVRLDRAFRDVTGPLDTFQHFEPGVGFRVLIELPIRGNERFHAPVRRP